MRRTIRLGFGVALFVSLCSAGHAAIQGEYIEARSADVYTGPCFANGEVGLRGNQAILGWKVRQGSWNGIALEGLSVVGVVRAGVRSGARMRPSLNARAISAYSRARSGDRPACASAAW